MYSIAGEITAEEVANFSTNKNNRDFLHSDLILKLGNGLTI